MSFISKLASVIPDTKAVVPTVIGNWSDAYLAPNMSSLTAFGGGATLYPADTGRTYIDKGYKTNPIVNAITSMSARKYSQIAFYHYKIKKDEVKTWAEYRNLTSKAMDNKAFAEAGKMRTKAIESQIIDGPLSKLLAKPNRNQTGAQFRETLFLYKLLTGEGNQWVSRGFDEQGNQITKGRPMELQVIPKANLLLIKGGDAWDIERFLIRIGNQEFRTPKENVIMWVNPNPEAELDGETLSHLRGFAPLESGRHMMQAFNEGAERLVNMNKNQGAAGFASAEHLNSLDANQTAFMRQQFDSIINNRGMAGKYTVLGGKWNVHQLGMNVDELKMMEQMDHQTQLICNILGFPPGLIAKDQTYENLKTAGRHWIFNTIAPEAYALSNQYTERLTPMFDLDRELNVVDADVAALPELQTDLKEHVTALKDAWWLNMDEKRVASGYDALYTDESQRYFVPTGLQSLEDLAAPLDYDVNDIN